jgi:hypothetical protein
LSREVRAVAEEEQAGAYLRRAGDTLRRWASDLAEVVLNNPSFGASEEARQRLVADFKAVAASLEQLEIPDPSVEGVSALLRKTLMDRFFPWNNASPVRAVLGPELGSHVRDRITRLAAPAGRSDPATAEADLLPLWTERLLADSETRLSSILTAARGLVEAAPHLDPALRDRLLGRLDGIRAGVESGTARAVLSADAAMAAALADLEADDRAGYEARSAGIEAELREWEPRLTTLEDRVRRIQESPLYGGRGAGTLGLVFLILSLTAGFFLSDRLVAVSFIASLALLNTLIWLAFNGISARLTRPYMDTLDHVKALTLSLKTLQDPHHLNLSRITELSHRLRT